MVRRASQSVKFVRRRPTILIIAELRGSGRFGTVRRSALPHRSHRRVQPSYVISLCVAHGSSAQPSRFHPGQPRRGRGFGNPVRVAAHASFAPAVINNLAGTRSLCRMVSRTAKLGSFLALQLRHRRSDHARQTTRQLLADPSLYCALSGMEESPGSVCSLRRGIGRSYDLRPLWMLGMTS